MPKNPETLVYEVEVVDITPAPPMPADVAAPPAGAKTLAGPNVPYELCTRARPGRAGAAVDTVTFNYTAWDATGRMFDTTEMRKRAASSHPFTQPPIVEEVLAAMTAGERIRFWADADRFATDGRPPPGTPKGTLCIRARARQHRQAEARPAAGPGRRREAAGRREEDRKGVFYKVLKSGRAARTRRRPTSCGPLHAAGRTDGRMFDSSLIHATSRRSSACSGVIAGLDRRRCTQMAAGDKLRFWIPDELAYKGAPGKPQGMLVFDIELARASKSATARRASRGRSTTSPRRGAGAPRDSRRSPAA